MYRKIGIVQKTQNAILFYQAKCQNLKLCGILSMTCSLEPPLSNAINVSGDNYTTMGDTNSEHTVCKIKLNNKHHCNIDA